MIREDFVEHNPMCAQAVRTVRSTLLPRRRGRSGSALSLADNQMPDAGTLSYAREFSKGASRDGSCECERRDGP